jgi:membrane-associated phospholipid phosphatase
MSKFLCIKTGPGSRLFGSLLLVAMAVSGLSDCAADAPVEPAPYRQATAFVLDWNRLLLELERFTPGYRAPVSARMFAYVELAAYEAAWPALKNYAATRSFCPGYLGADVRSLPERYCLPAGLTAAYAQVCRDFFPNAPQEYLDKIDQLEAQHLKWLQNTASAEVLQGSIAYGQQVAKSVWDWSATDSAGHNGFLYNYDQHYTPPKSEGLWQPTTEHAMPALLPNWGDARTFITNTDQLIARLPVAFSEAPGSSFYTEALEVFSVSQSLSRENRWIAEFWSDDLPGLTMSPAGRWISITNQAVVNSPLAFPEVIATYLKVGMALCDASIICWHEKYKYNVERPDAYIRRIIQPGWAPLHESPSFPSYPSGHSMFGAAAASVLAATFGENFSFTDRTHEDRREFAGTPRSFRSFAEMAQENAFSRVAIGVHYRMDCEEGLRLGKIIGQKVVALPLRLEDATALRR